MKFRVEHTFRGITLEEYEKLYFNEDFNIALCQAVKLARTKIKFEEKDGHIARIVKVGPDREIPPPAAKILGANRIEYTEHVDYDLGSYRGAWHTVSSLLTDKVDSRGSFTFSQAAGGVRRVVEGVIKVKLFGVGGVVEKFIVADVEKSYDKAAGFTQQWIDKGND